MQVLSGLKLTHLNYALVAGLFFSFAVTGCKDQKTETLTLKNGDSVQYEHTEGNPALQSTNWMSVQKVEARFYEPLEEGLPGRLSYFFDLDLKTDEIRTIRISDVTGTYQPLLVNATNMKARDGHRRFETEQRVVTERTMPWVYQGNSATRVFKITLIDKNDRPQTVYQVAQFDTATIRGAASPG